MFMYVYSRLTLILWFSQFGVCVAVIPLVVSQHGVVGVSIYTMLLLGTLEVIGNANHRVCQRLERLLSPGSLNIWVSNGLQHLSLLPEQTHDVLVHFPCLSGPFPFPTAATFSTFGPSLWPL